MAIRHIVLFQLAAKDAKTRDEHAAEMKERLEGLVGVVPDLLEMTVVRNVAYEEQNFDVALDALFPDLAALEAYGTHPAHVEVAKYIGTIRSDRAAIDFEV